MTRSPATESGFTLVEMLVALALLSIMTLYAWQTLAMMQQFKTIADRTGNQMEVDAAARHMRNTIADARGILGHNAAGQPVGLFKGRPHSVEFIATSDGTRETGGFYVVTYSLNEKGDLESTRRLFRETQNLPETKIKLLGNVKQISFKYFGQDAVAKDDWEGKLIPPSAVEVTVEFVDGDKRNWPPVSANIETSFMQANEP